MVGHYKLEARQNSGEAAVKETAIVLSPQLNRRCEMVNEVAQITTKQCMRMGELWCGGCGAAQQRSAWQW
jgi:hypothetical protein